jgi:hypothetical protein
MRRCRKGLFYIYVSSIMLLAIIIVFAMRADYSYLDRQKVSEARINSLNDLLHDLESDSERVIYVSAYRSLIALEDYVASTGKYLNDTEEYFRIAFYNGTVNGSRVDVLENSTYSDYLGKVRFLTSLVGADLDVNVTRITLFHQSPWEVTVVVSAEIRVNDTKGLASWKFNKNYSTVVPLTNIRDPVYSIGTYGKVPNTIRPTNISASDFVVESTNSTAGLQEHINSTRYLANPQAPSYLMRMQGNFSPSPYGIESLVFIPELDVQSVPYSSQKSIVDYILLTNATGYYPLLCSFTNMPSWFKIDQNHSADYEVNALNYSAC